MYLQFLIVQTREVWTPTVGGGVNFVWNYFCETLGWVDPPHVYLYNTKMLIEKNNS